ncbi:hypothetical protein BD779DRAFT_1521296 [Infundibulicybe gibba]|nr:hypothetical protein BD779DRAFT_1521296 [Infundibulicybe gibba]
MMHPVIHHFCSSQTLISLRRSPTCCTSRGSPTALLEVTAPCIMSATRPAAAV